LVAMMKLKIWLVLLIWLILMGSNFKLVLSSSCVVRPVKPYETNPQCYYSDPPEGIDYYDSCYQQYLVMKADYETRCFRYWDEKNLQNLTQPQENLVPQVIEKTVIQEVVVSPSPVPRNIKRKAADFSPEPFSVTEYSHSSPSPEAQFSPEVLGQSHPAQNQVIKAVNLIINFFRNLFMGKE
ncbi:MAG: hypothetical protein V1719_02770, partial [Patescibacteria group bacterium]